MDALGATKLYNSAVVEEYWRHVVFELDTSVSSFFTSFLLAGRSVIDIWIKRQRFEMPKQISAIGVAGKNSKHYENTPIQIYRKFHLQKLKIFR